jgi:hypothetical protein
MIMENMQIRQDSEDKRQADCWQWLWNTYLNTRGLCFHIRNGGSLKGTKQERQREGNKFKAMGVLAGMPDLCLAIAGKQAGTSSHGLANALYIEMKTDKGKESPEQLQRHKELRAANNRVEVVRSLTDFQIVIHDYLSLNNFYLLK